MKYHIPKLEYLLIKNNLACSTGSLAGGGNSSAPLGLCITGNSASVSASNCYTFGNAACTLDKACAYGNINLVTWKSDNCLSGSSVAMMGCVTGGSANVPSNGCSTGNNPQ